MRILGIESSCDETGLAIYDGEKGVLGEVLYSQIPAHAIYGGVVPELASRDHIRKISPLLKALLKEANLTLEEIDGIAYTQGPGLQGALLVGATFAKSLAFALGKPALGVHHLEAHLMAGMLDKDKPDYPFLALLISGGHTQLLAVKGLGRYTLLGESVDDAVGEAFDKTAKLLGLPYPGGPALSLLAKKGDKDAYKLPRPMTNRPGLDFSFSGLKTHVLRAYEASDKSDDTKANIAASFQKAVTETLMIKCRRALKDTGLNTLLVSGGVAANESIRAGLSCLMTKQKGKIYFPSKEYCTDNGTMVAYLGWLYLSKGKKDSSQAISVYARKPLADG
jgi:N6-L-threonylcarbamoyladenine synthase